MVQKLVVACVQQKIRLPQSVDDYRADLTRFMRAAQNKNARLIVFPELAGLMLALPLLADFRSQLLKRADMGTRRNASLWTRLSSAISGSAAAALRADLRTGIAGLLDVDAAALWGLYSEIYGDLARTYGMTVIAPSAYLPDPLDGVIRNLAGVFGTGGELLGTQAKVILHPEDEDLAQPGTGWDVIPTEVGRVGLMLGNDILFPEVGRIHAFQGAEILAGMGACPDPALYNKIRAGMLARMQDNQLFGLISFMVGTNQLSGRGRQPYMGKSAVFAPQELTPRFSGVLVEMGNHRTEGVLSAEWDFAELRGLWESSDTPVRRQLPASQVNQLMTSLYSRLQGDEPLQLDTTAQDQPTESPVTILSLDDLPVYASVTSRWPLSTYHDDPMADDWSEDWGMDRDATPPAPAPSVRFDDETDEMDALPHRSEE